MGLQNRSDSRVKSAVAVVVVGWADPARIGRAQSGRAGRRSKPAHSLLVARLASSRGRPVRVGSRRMASERSASAGSADGRHRHICSVRGHQLPCWVGRAGDVWLLRCCADLSVVDLWSGCRRSPHPYPARPTTARSAGISRRSTDPYLHCCCRRGAARRVHHRHCRIRINRHRIGPVARRVGGCGLTGARSGHSSS